ncbi:MAG: leucyl aminopeptidase [Elusimicrobia bacterium]|nr:leucyl aminopeptidase [Elusimicrobiota bacterium]
MNLTIDSLDRSRFKGERDTLALFLWEGEKFTAEGWLDSKKEDSLEAAAKREGFKAKAGETFLSYPEKEEPVMRLLLIGLGKKKDAKIETLRDGAGKAYKASSKQSETLWIDLPQWPEKISAEALAQAVTEGVLLGRYRYVKHKTDDEQKKKEFTLKKTVLVVERPEEIDAAKRGIKRGDIYAQAINFIRDLINEPPSLKRPREFAKISKGLESSRIKVRIYSKQELERMGMRSILGVNAGSVHDPIFTHFIYKPKGAPKKRIGLVGKGITFDSGGLNIKTGNHMSNMKMDMAGAATIMACLRACDALDVASEIHGFAPFTENMPGENAYKPGDVIQAYNGKTIEILNTDAEGRVVLADALSFAVKQNLDAIIDVATLTGAVVVALGDQISGLLSNNERLARDLLEASKRAGEKVWQLPLLPEYKERIKGKVGDWANISTRGGAEPGSIIGGLFLEEFVDSKPWAHFDIAGTAWTDSETPTCVPGGTGAIARTLLEYILAL